MNLAANAVRYTREGGVLIGCRLRAGVARIEIWDTGCGIAPDQTKHIFEEFYQSHRHADEGVKGVGLGLAIVDRLAGLLGLPIDLRSIEGRGSNRTCRPPSQCAADLRPHRWRRLGARHPRDSRTA